METKEYTVTDQAGPRVAGRAVKKGEVLALTEAQASAELLSGAIVPKGEEPKRSAKGNEPSKRLESIQARAKGFDTPEEAEAAEQEAQTPPAETGKPTGKPSAAKPAVAGDVPAA